MRYRATTDDLLVTVQPEYVDDEVTENGHRYVWRYEITLENFGDTRLQLINRHWDITDSLGLTEQIDGPGVVGEQPIIRPGTRYTYRSFTTLATPSGFMGGYYEMVDLDHQRPFRAKIPTFSLDSPDTRPTLN